MNKPKNRKQVIEEFVNSCTLVFKSFEYDVVISKNKANLWHFSANKLENNYVIYCAPEIKKVRGILKVAMKKIPDQHRLVVISSEYSASDEAFAEELEFTLITLKKIKRYGEDLLQARLREDT